MTRKKRLRLIGDVLGVLFTIIIFIVPFYFMFVQSIKTQQEANQLLISWPKNGIHLVENYSSVLHKNHGQLILAFKNSAILTIGTVAGLLVFSSMAAYVIQRRRDRLMKTVTRLNNTVSVGLRHLIG